MADPIWLQQLKRALSGPSRRPTNSVSGVEPATSAVSPNMYHQRFSEGSFGDMPNIGYAAAGKPTVQYHTPMAGKKGLSVENMIRAMSELKAPTGMPFGKAGSRPRMPRPTAPSPRALGVDALEMASADDPRKKWWKQWQGLMGV